MLPKPFRLTSERDFAKVFSAQGGSAARGKCGRSFSCGVLVFKNALNNLPVSRFGVVVANSVIKKAHNRNRVKRLIRAVLLKYYKQFRPGKDVVIISRKGIEKETFQTLETVILNVLRKIGLLF